MSDTMSCPNCSATLPAGAAFCTSCGTRIEAGSAPAAAPPEDATRVDNPGLHDATQTFTPPAPAPAPWQPAETSAPPAPAAPAWEQPAAPAAPAWQQPAAPAAPPWQQPAPPQAPAWQQPAAPPGGGWTPPGAAPGGPGGQQWGAPAPAPAGSGSAGASPLGGIVAVLGGILTLVGLFTAWLGNNQDSITLTGWDLAGGDSPFESKDPYLLLALGIVALAVGALLFLGKARGAVRIVAIVVGVAIIGTHVRDWLSIQDLVKDFPTGVEVKAEFGFYLGCVGGGLTALAALLPGKKAA